MRDGVLRHVPELELSEQDVTEAMQEIPGYLDITPGDFRELYQVALRHAWQRLRRRVRVRDVMTPRVVTVQAGTPLDQVAERMAREGVSGVPVVDAQGHVVGVISEADFLAQMADAAATGFMGVIAQCLQGKRCLAVPVRGRTAGDIMSTPPVTVQADASVHEAAERLATAAINRLPVVDAQGVVVGIVSRADLVQAHLA